MAENANNQIKERLNSIFPNPQVASKIVDMVIHNRPLGWSRKSNAPYYKEMYAEQVRDDIDKMVESGNPICYRYAKWCNEDTNMSKQTLYNRINQSIRYLIEQLDMPDRKYRKWYETVHVERVSGVGVTITFIVGLHDKQSFRADEVQPRDNMPQWQRRMEDWLESDSIKPFCEEGLCLSPEQIAELTTNLSNLTNVQASVKCESVKIIRINE